MQRGAAEWTAGVHGLEPGRRGKKVPGERQTKPVWQQQHVQQFRNNVLALRRPFDKTSTSLLISITNSKQVKRGELQTGFPDK